MSRRNLKASSARPSQTPLQGRADDASCLTLNTVAHPPAAFHADGASEFVVRGTPATLSLAKESERGKDAAVFARPHFVVRRRYEIRTIQYQ